MVAPSSLASSGTSCWSPRAAEKGFARKINYERTLEGAGRLRLDPELSRVARMHTRTMVRRQLLHHSPTSILSKRVTNWVLLGENVGVGSRVGSLHDAFMASPSHRDNVLTDAYRHVGIGTRRAQGRLWVTVIFEAVTDPGTTLRMPSC